MNPAAEPIPRVGAVRSVAAWCVREAVTVVAALLVAGFLLVTPVVPGETLSGDYVEYSGTSTALPLGPLVIVAGLCVVAGVLLAKRHVVLATTLTLLPFLVVPWWQIFVWGWFLGTIAVAMVAATVSWRHAATPYLASLAIVVFYCASDIPAVLPIGLVTAGTGPGPQIDAFALYVVAITAVVAISASISASTRARRRQLAAATQEAHALRVELVVSERAQVARDLHDVVAHHVSLVAVRAESAPYQHPALGDEARAVLAEIAEDARQALGELRQVLVVLQRAEGSGNEQASRAPQPEAGDVDELVLSARAAGQRVEETGRWGVVPSAQGYVLYRAVQEGLTNARRHAPRSAVTLTRTQVGSRIGFTMTNTARGAGPVEPGRGTIGMRERVESLGGTMAASVLDDRFELAVALPVTVSAEAEHVQVGA